MKDVYLAELSLRALIAPVPSKTSAFLSKSSKEKTQKHTNVLK